MLIKILLILLLFHSFNLLLAEDKAEVKKAGDYLVNEDGSLVKLEDARKQARREANKLHRYDFKYYAGEFLIYDCFKRHFACVNKSSFDYCKSARKKTKVEGYAVFACAPMKKFGSLTECLKKQYEVMHKLPNKLFCINTAKASANRKETFTEITTIEEQERKEEEKIQSFIIKSK